MDMCTYFVNMVYQTVLVLLMVVTHKYICCISSGTSLFVETGSTLFAKTKAIFTE